MAYYLYIIAGILILPGIIYGLYAQVNVSRTFNAFKTIDNKKGLTAYEVANQILQSAGISDVKINKIKGDLTDNYDPRNKTLNLSDSTFNSKSVSAIGVAAHEVGHALQHHEGYKPLKIRNAFVPIVNFASRMFFIVLIIGIILTLVTAISSNVGRILIWVAVAMYGSSTLFYFITVPIEYNASKRAIEQIRTLNLLEPEELPLAQKVLNAAAQTYVSNLIISALYFLRFFLYIFILFGRHKD